jgi:hypothetical protein
VGHGPKSQGSRPHSAKSKANLAKGVKVAQAPSNNSSIATYLQLKKSGLLKGWLEIIQLLEIINTHRKYTDS